MYISKNPQFTSNCFYIDALWMKSLLKMDKIYMHLHLLPIKNHQKRYAVILGPKIIMINSATSKLFKLK